MILKSVFFCPQGGSVFLRWRERKEYEQIKWFPEFEDTADQHKDIGVSLVVLI